MAATISIEATGPELKELLEHLPKGETVAIVRPDGSRAATLVVAGPPEGKAMTREEWLAEWDALSERITKAWKSEKNAIEIISEMRR